ncbi:uncharacterized protein KY384_002917 [Bacidia gigantensis]|uniref:uncharacterized protein n=1 Tax=Bacidia gigantensis TaxID=2732470 RepID=UPI001D03773E|nr:uncharacterized protein KY384_002917 [Bacidia gigantensis]KAG8532432.1 hypothetical protein KY384_002917 [Bacidia gigantensis]
MKFISSHALLAVLALPTKSFALPATADSSLDDIEHVQLDSILNALGNESHVPFSGTGPVNTSAFIEEVRRVFLNPLPASARDLPQFRDGVDSHVVWRNWRAFVGVTENVDIRAPWTALCRPVINGVKPLATPIFCSGVPCSPRVSFRVEERYETQESFRVETTVSLGASQGPFEASVSRTTERFWQRIWSTSTSQESTYQWHLGPNDHCTPSMAHVELDCDVDLMTTYYDSFLHDSNRLRLEHDHHRKGGPYWPSQWCTQFVVDHTPLRREEDWERAVSSNRGRGDVWKRPAREMRPYRRSGNSIQDNMLIVRRPSSSPGDWGELMGCIPDRSTARRVKMTLPLSSANGVLHGFVGCVSSGRSGSSVEGDELDAELKAKA